MVEVMSRPKKNFIAKNVLLQMLKLAQRYDNLKEAYRTMVRRKKCEPYNYQAYLDNMKKLPEYLTWKNKRYAHNKEIRENIMYYHKQGLKDGEIALKLGISHSRVYKVLTKKDTTAEIKARKVVNWWNTNKIEGRFMTKETKEAFKLLGLEIPKL